MKKESRVEHDCDKLVLEMKKITAIFDEMIKVISYMRQSEKQARKILEDLLEKNDGKGEENRIIRGGETETRKRP